MRPKPIEPIDHHEVSLPVATIQIFKQQGTSPPPYPRISVFGRSFLDQLPGCGGVFLFIRQQFQTFEPPSSLPSRAVPRPWHEETPETPSYPILSCLSRPRIAAPRRAASRCGRLRPPASDAGSPQAVFRGLSSGRAGAKMPFVLPIRSPHPWRPVSSVNKPDHGSLLRGISSRASARSAAAPARHRDQWVMGVVMEFFSWRACKNRREVSG